MSRNDFKPESLNVLYENNFKLSFSKIPNVTFYTQDLEIPSVSIGISEQPTRFTTIKRPGEKITFEEMTVNFKVQEDLQNWIEVFNWMKEIGRPEEITAGMRDLSEQDLVADATIELLTNNFNLNKKIVFRDCFPTNLQGLTLDVKSGDIPVISSVTFAYTTYDIVDSNLTLDNCSVS